MKSFLQIIIISFLFVSISIGVNGQDISTKTMEIHPLDPSHHVKCPLSHMSHQFKLPAKRDPNKKRKTQFIADYGNTPAAFQETMEIVFDFLGDFVESDVPVYLNFNYGEQEQGVLASAGPTQLVRNFPNAPFVDTDFAIAIAEKIAKRDLNTPGAPDIAVTINSAVDWHAPFNDQEGIGRKFDLGTILLHEIIHGLGFFDSFNFDEETGQGILGAFTNGNVPVSFDKGIVNRDNEALVDLPSPSLELGDELTSDGLFMRSRSFPEGAAPKIFAPVSWQGGSSIAHLDERTYSGTRNALLTPSFMRAELIYFPGDLTLDILGDIGWVVARLNHTPALFTENLNQDYEVSVSLDSDIELDESTITLHTSTDGFVTEEIIPLQGSNGAFSGILSATGQEQTIQYYFEIQGTEGGTFTNPGEAPKFYFTYRWIANDTEGPILEHEDGLLVRAIDSSVIFRLDASDEISGIESAQVITNLNGVSQTHEMQREYGDFGEFEFEYNIGRGFTPNDNLTYTFSVNDKSNNSNTSVSPATGTYSVNYALDVLPPTIDHEVIESTTNFESQLIITVFTVDSFTVNNNNFVNSITTGISSASVEVRVNGVSRIIDLEPQESTFNNSLGFGGFYEGIYNNGAPFNPDDIVEYRITSNDKEFNPNTSFFPGGEEYVQVNVRNIPNPILRYLNDFNVADNDFRSNGFSTAQPAGFSNGAIHSRHPYQVAGGNGTLNFFHELNQPIVVGNDNTIIEFDEIVLVEPSVRGVRWPNGQFWDYCIVEARDLRDAEWKPLLDGYDSRDKASWLDAYGADEGSSTTVGTPSLFERRTIDIRDSGDFISGDTIVVRFRLFSDPAANGWGWAIDNLKIQENSTPIEDFILEQNFIVIPNPAQDQFDLSLDLESKADALDIRVYNLQGALMEKRSIVKPGFKVRSRFDVSNYSEGAYLVQITFDNKETITKKVIVKH